jgi:hypothetical protein
MNEIVGMIFSSNLNGWWFLDKAGERQNGQKLFGSFLTLNKNELIKIGCADRFFDRFKTYWTW